MSEDPIIAPLSWPLLTVAFEAGSLDEGSYPIKMGVCRSTSSEQPIEG